MYLGKEKKIRFVAIGSCKVMHHRSFFPQRKFPPIHNQQRKQENDLSPYNRSLELSDSKSNPERANQITMRPMGIMRRRETIAVR